MDLDYTNKVMILTGVGLLFFFSLCGIIPQCVYESRRRSKEARRTEAARQYRAALPDLQGASFSMEELRVSYYGVNMVTEPPNPRPTHSGVAVGVDLTGIAGPLLQHAERQYVERQYIERLNTERRHSQRQLRRQRSIREAATARLERATTNLERIRETARQQTTAIDRETGDERQHREPPPEYRAVQRMGGEDLPRYNDVAVPLPVYCPTGGI